MEIIVNTAELLAGAIFAVVVLVVVLLRGLALDDRVQSRAGSTVSSYIIICTEHWQAAAFVMEPGRNGFLNLVILVEGMPEGTRAHEGHRAAPPDDGQLDKNL